jgi:hypothetical protein
MGVNRRRVGVSRTRRPERRPPMRRAKGRALDERAPLRPRSNRLVQRALLEELGPAEEPDGPTVSPRASPPAPGDRHRISQYGELVVGPGVLGGRVHAPVAHVGEPLWSACRGQKLRSRVLTCGFATPRRRRASTSLGATDADIRSSDAMPWGQGHAEPPGLDLSASDSDFIHIRFGGRCPARALERARLARLSPAASSGEAAGHRGDRSF